MSYPSRPRTICHLYKEIRTPNLTLWTCVSHVLWSQDQYGTGFEGYTVVSVTQDYCVHHLVSFTSTGPSTSVFLRDFCGSHKCSFSSPFTQVQNEESFIRTGYTDSDPLLIPSPIRQKGSIERSSSVLSPRPTLEVCLVRGRKTVRWLCPVNVDYSTSG